MKLDSLGLNHFVFGSATCHAVAPLSSALSSVHSRAQPPQSSSLMPRFFLYHSRRARSSVFALMNTPPIPVILAIFFLSFLNKFLSGNGSKSLQFQIVAIAETSLIHEYFKRRRISWRAIISWKPRMPKIVERIFFITNIALRLSRFPVLFPDETEDQTPARAPHSASLR